MMHMFVDSWQIGSLVVRAGEDYMNSPTVGDDPLLLILSEHWIEDRCNSFTSQNTGGHVWVVVNIALTYILC